MVSDNIDPSPYICLTGVLATEESKWDMARWAQPSNSHSEPCLSLRLHQPRYPGSRCNGLINTVVFSLTLWRLTTRRRPCRQYILTDYLLCGHRTLKVGSLLGESSTFFYFPGGFRGLFISHSHLRRQEIQWTSFKRVWKVDGEDRNVSTDLLNPIHCFHLINKQIYSACLAHG